VVARFFGTYEHTLDAKGRVILPVRFRAAFDEGGYLTQNLDGCLALWTPEEFDTQMVQRREQESAGRSERNQARIFSANSFQVEIDRQGRLPIPAYLREFAGLQENVRVSGIFNRVELWDPGRWEERVRPEEQRLAEGLEA
jgi:MraZ protein